MNRAEWRAIEEAGKLLGLGSRASLSEIKQAYRRLSKLHHPDTGAGGGAREDSEQMYQLTAAYDLLMRYGSAYPLPLQRDEADTTVIDMYDPEDWWRVRFGQDPIWSGKKKR
ncbi:J domain-containing protein [Desulfobulbus alkaliphilus]|uniref:J domain-containing protein n=1 Tax=Desulfobulbus alkaliphilus TaxID=869814 RepID=UPI0019655060|nr:J domain-containing protein [Desulfobulbus alkaliphilus]MBM9536790.1 J domain-containing protein [Desulfobulbus alkaliphilus]